jgi:UDP-N-acetylmuramate dehydrogenase
MLLVQNERSPLGILMSTLQHLADLRPLNTFGLPARAEFLLTIEDPAQIGALLEQPGLAAMPLLILGGGSNIVLRGDFAGLVVRVAIRGRRLVGEDADAWYVEGGAGENWHEFVRWTLDMGWPGLENLSLIPGTVGAAPIQNIGAYGLEVAECFHSLQAVSMATGQPMSLGKAECSFGYRDSIFKRELAGNVMITAVTFRLPKQWVANTRYADVARELAALGVESPTPTEVSDAVIAIRQRKLPDPALLGNAGSFFKNPVVDSDALAHLLAAHPELPHYPQPDGRSKLAAGWLIDQCGWKGRNLGPVGAYEKQALILVNRGGAKGGDVQRLANAIQCDVAARFGVSLEPEPIFV